MPDPKPIIARLEALMEQDAQPDELRIDPTFNDDHSVDIRFTLSLPQSGSIPATMIEKTEVFTIIPDAKDGYTLDVKSKSVLTSPDGTFITSGSLARIDQNIPGFQNARWFKPAILKSTFTRNRDLTDERDLVNRLGFTPAEIENPSTYPTKLHVLQDCLEGILSGQSYTVYQHIAIAGFLANLPEGFWEANFEKKYFGIPFGEIYFTYFWMQSATNRFLTDCHRGLTGMTETEQKDVYDLYVKSGDVLRMALQGSQFEHACQRGWFQDKFLEDGQSRCDVYDKRLKETRNERHQTVIADPFLPNSPKTTAGKWARNLGQNLLETGINALADMAEDGEAMEHLSTATASAIENNPQAVAEFLEAAQTVLEDPAVRQAASDLTVTALDTAGYIAENPGLSQSLKDLSQTLLELSVNLAPQDPEALLTIIRESEADDHVQQLLSAMFGKVLEFSDEALRQHHDLIVSQAEAIALLGLETARSDRVQDELEKTLLDYMDSAIVLFSNPEFQARVSETATLVANIMMGNANEVLSDNEFRDGLADILAEQLIPYTDIMSNALQASNEEAVATMLSHFVSTTMESVLISFDTPEFQRTIDRLLDILPMLKEKIKYLLKTPAEQRLYDLNKPNRFLPTFKRSIHAHNHLVQPDEEKAGTFFGQSGEIEFNATNSVGLTVPFQVTLHENAVTYMLPNGGMVASINLRGMGYTTEKTRKALTDMHHKTRFFKSHAAVKDYELVDLQGHFGTMASLVDDGLGFGNKCSFVDIKGRPHYLTYQEIIVGDGNPNEEYVLDMWIEKDSFQPGKRGEMVLAWDVLPTDDKQLEEWRKENGFEAKNLETDKKEIVAWRRKHKLKPKHMTNANFKKLTGKLCEPGKTQRAENTGAWQIIDEDGDGMIDTLSLGASIDGTQSSSGLFQYQILDYLTTMAILFEEYE